ncbi:hypothetical protein OIN59_12000 [Acidovorax sp. D2M1]|uniref:Uncharacterized protein n=1 Tax=Acidovorax benzenivorans TaxID=2987520 RepID=A0ABT5RWT1_9BURK|nr:hypothetical protein [Acidovorax benzenivorans]MDD2178158.1 hypothetical protein [Acidovorax benzenivorans]
MKTTNAAITAAVLMLSTLGTAYGKTISEEQALRTCQKTLKQAARDPETAVVPDVGAMRGGADRRFLWNANSRLVRMRNGMGIEVGVIALCVVDEETGRIKLLTLDSKQLISPGNP